MQQVHGSNVVVVDSKNIGQTISDCDGLVTNDPNVTLIVRTADCLPISIIDYNQKVIALIHAGWRGLHKEIIKNAVNILINKFKCNLENLEIKIGPHICQKHYEIGEEVASLFPNTKKYLSLKDIAINQLTKLGIFKENIEVDLRCTFEDTSLPSHRRDRTDKRLISEIKITG